MPHDAPAPLHILRLSDLFDGVAARRLEAWLAALQPATQVRIDLSKVREFHDFGLAVLAQALSRCRAEVTVVGLRQHQVRMLRYFGVEASRLEPAPGAAAGLGGPQA
ncbi:STAS domain-containing protein [Anaeromyxobacter paludicola]|uniref:MlaB-like STAS domain-containing protein n=1 Tax=Anaeromyxobacter paludicola TaxID=2918171 RepID=A0ABM7XAF1_9BACT|nr:STAS domain-containing protein [Anaeromyxobacter paludicola]BDG08832.1 hypothetical protein AMPC_19450 [Anaeromyxobacter paludicola]